MSRAQGVSEQQLRDLSVFETSAAFSPVERIVLELTVALAQTPAEVSDELRKRLAEHFDERQRVELVAAIAWENYRARFNRAFGVGPAGFSEGAYCVLPER